MTRRARKSRKKAVIHEPSAKQLQIVEWCFLAVLLGLGIYQSVIYFGHQVVPNADFTGFVKVAQQIASFELPSNYKRLPVLGLLQIGLGSIIGGQHPNLTAGWFLNAVLHPFNIVLIWLVGRQVIGKPALWMAVVAATNASMLKMMTHPIVETTLLFFILLTFYFITKRSGWAYLFASVASMVRYEGAILIMVVFIMDMIYAKDRKERFRAFLFAAAASVPFGLWMLGTVLTWTAQGQGHYLKSLGSRSGGKIVLLEYIQLTWLVSVDPLIMLDPKASEDSIEVLSIVSMVVTATSFTLGMIYSFIKRNWYVPALFVFLLLYLIIHAVQGSLFRRHCVAIYWIVLIICLYGFCGLWALLNRKGRIPKPIIILLQISLFFVLIWFLTQVAGHLPKIAKKSPTSAYIPYFASAAVLLIFILRRVIYRTRFFVRDLCISALVCFMVVSNQFILVRIMKTGKLDMEFKMLADWYVTDAGGSGKLVTTMSNVVTIFAPEYKGQFVHTVSIDANNPNEFVKACYENDITYVAWDSRLGMVPHDLYYKKWRLKNIEALGYPEDIGPYEFVKQIYVDDRRYINIFRLKPLPARPTR